MQYTRDEEHVLIDPENAAPTDMHVKGPHVQDEVEVALVVSHIASSTPSAVSRTVSVDHNIVSTVGGPILDGETHIGAERSFKNCLQVG